MKLGIHGLPLRSAVAARRRLRLRILAAMSALCIVGFIAAVGYEIWPQRGDVIADVASVFTPSAPAGIIPAAAPVSARPVYRHSIVPGGAYSRAEVAGAMRNDAVVAAHYQSVDVDKVHATTVSAPRAVYVSYRVGDQVYWTKNRVRLSPGETLLTDGDTEIRARCGNLLSDDARQPVAAQEPPLAALDNAEPETGSSTMAGARDEEGPTHVPFLQDASSLAMASLDPAATTPPAFDHPMWFGGGVGGGMSPYLGSSTGTNGTSLVAPLGGSGRNNGGGPNGGGPNGGGPNGGGPNGGGPNGGGPNGGGPNGGGPNGGGPNGGGPNSGGPNGGGPNGGGPNDGGPNGGGPNDGGPNGGGPNGGGPNGGGPNGGGHEDPPIYIPPTLTDDEVTTTTGDSETTTTGDVVRDTTGSGDNDGDVPSVPEPATLVLLGVGACGAAARALRRRR